MRTINVPDEGLLTAAAKGWAEGRKPVPLACELWVRVVQLSAVVMELAKECGCTLPEANLPEAGPVPAESPVVHPDLNG